ncbi:MAG: D-arabinose 5-phosphate isomerase, partial [Plesiomonas sp.]
MPNAFDFQHWGRHVLTIERDSIDQLDQYIDANFAHACKLIYECSGKVVVMGMGKSGHIGRKIAATF